MKSKKLKKLLALALTTAMLFSNGMMSSQAFAKEVSIDDETTVHVTGASSGVCGENLTWTLDEDGTLTISGSGEMYDYDFEAPWENYNFNSAIIEEGVTSIGERAFLGCRSLSSISIPEGVTSIGTKVFWGCSSLSSISIPKSVTSIGENTFDGCSSLSSISVSEDNKCYCSKDGVLYNKEKTYLIQYPVGKLDTMFSIPEGITSIGTGAFESCSSLSSISIPESVTSIEDRAFRYCSSLSSISIPESVTSIGIAVFFDCSNLSSISIPEGVASIGDYAFYRCSRLRSINIPEGVTSIGDYAFSYCSSLSSISIPESVTDIGDAAFSQCKSLQSINVLDDNKCYYSKDGVLYNKGKTDLIQYPAGKIDTIFSIPEGVTSISYAAFFGCSNLSSINIPEGVTSIGIAAFWDCSNLSSINIPEGVTSIGDSVFCGCSSLSSISIPESVISIGGGAFNGCSSLNSIIIPEGVTSIEDYAFYGCSDLTIYCYADSVAHTYAINNKISYELLEKLVIDISKATVTLSESKYTYDGTAKTPGVTVKLSGKTLKKNTDYTVSYSNNKNIGTATVTVKGTGNYSGTVKTTFTIAAQSLSKAKVTLSKATYYYDGKSKTPGVTVKLSGKTLKQNTDYTVSYSNNKNIGTATVTVKGTGNYSGTVKTTFTIAAQSLSKAKVTLSKSTYYYDGTAKTPGVTVKLSGKTLKKNTDYTVSYSNNKNIGTATVTVKGTGNYSGTVKTTFKITVKKGASYTVGAYKYNITSTSAVAFAGIKSTKTTKVVIPKTVKIGEKTFKVTSIASKALYKQTKVTSVTIGENVTSIGKEAFRNCSKLSTITIKSIKLNTVGANVFKGIKATAKINVPSKKLSAYKKLLKGKGQGSKVKITK